MLARSIMLFILLLVCLLPAGAQICNGSLGDPIINITFGSGPNPGASLSAATTNYQYVNTDCPQDGFYALRNSSISCHGNTWHSITDHTGNANGYFMLINASIQPSAFYLDTVRGLCGNTTYEFAAWVVNVLKSTACGGAGIQPNLTFRMEKTDGTVLQTYNTGNIPQTNTPQWKQFGFFFTTPGNTQDVVLRIINNSQGGCGNDLAIDDITFRPCGPQISSAITGTLSNTVMLCEGTAQTYTFTANVSVGFNAPMIQWQQSINGGVWTDIAGANSTIYTKHFTASNPSGNYHFRLAAAEAGNMSTPQCRIASSPLTIQVSPNPVPAANSNSPVCESATVTMQVNAASASWTGPNAWVASGNSITISNATMAHSGKYYVTAINGVCTQFDSVMVVVHPRPVVTIDKDTVAVCQGDSVQLNLAGAAVYSWIPSHHVYATSSQVFVFPSDTTFYAVKGDNALGCSDTVTVLVNTIRKPVANAGADRTLAEGMPIQLKGEATGDSISYYWLPDIGITGAQTLSPYISPASDMEYYLHVDSHLGCGFAQDTMKVHVYKKLSVANAFSPNKDGINDEWRISGLNSYPTAEVTVYDRYGRKVFGSKNFMSWDGTLNGKLLAPGTYYYIIRLPLGFVSAAGWVLIMY